MVIEKKIERLKYLAGMIAKYAHRWSENPSDRLYGWIDEYEDIRSNECDSFVEYCKRVGADTTHTAYDNLA